MNKRINPAAIQTFVSVFIALFASFSTFAQTEVALQTNESSYYITPDFTVYSQVSPSPSLEAFLEDREKNAFTFKSQASFSFINEGLWFHTRARNLTNETKWVLSTRFAQLQDVRVYVLENDKVIYQGQDGNVNKSSYHASATFEVELPRYETVDIYVYVSSSSMSLLVPMYLQTESAHYLTTQIDFLIWGSFYGALLLFALYALILILKYRSIAHLFFFMHIVVLWIWQFNWSGHTRFVGENLERVFTLLKPEEIFVLLCISSSVFTAKLLSRNPLSSYMRICLPSFITLACAVFILLCVSIFPGEVRFVITYLIGMLVLVVNLLVAFNALKHNYPPARAITFAWVIITISAIACILHIFGYFDENVFNRQFYQLALSLQAGAFLLAIGAKIHTELETELEQARSDAENNYLLAEEQNVHLEIARRDAVKASEVKSQFLANMSHEIRTPLNAIIGFSKELETKATPAERDEHVKIINSAGTDLLNLINGILDFSKMEANQLSLNIKPFKPLDLFEDIAASMSKTAHLKETEFIYDVDKVPEYLLGDMFRVKQIISNLVSNALKFTNYGHVILRIKVASQSAQTCTLIIEVIDSGIGISESDIDNIFKAFHQLDDELNRSYQGTGLGLVICQELVYMMQGKLSVSSEPLVGSTFEVTIPFDIHTPENHKPLALPFENNKAIVVDEWDLSRNSSIRQLQLSGFEVMGFENLDQVPDYDDIQERYLFVTLPNAEREERQALVTTIKHLDVPNTIVLFSGRAPSDTLMSSAPKTSRWLRLPLTGRKVANLQADGMSISPSEKEIGIQSLPSVRMLAVDDMELNLKLISAWLKHSPITLDLAYDGAGAIRKCEQFEYDIILMDIQMPTMDGIETTKRIRKTALNMGTPIIAVTAHALEEEKQYFLESGLEDFLSKPIQLERLIALVNEWCDFDETSGIADMQSVPDVESIDWDLAVKRAAYSTAGAVSFFDDFIMHLGGHKDEIEHYAQNNNVKELIGAIHKLNGACCYTGVPKLETVCSQLQSNLKNDPAYRFNHSVSELLREIEVIKQAWKKRRVNIA